jgi:hypothetical protein
MSIIRGNALLIVSLFETAVPHAIILSSTPITAQQELLHPDLP